MTHQALAQRLNRALHELRRPVQLLALRPDPPREVAAIASALDEIDRIVNGAGSGALPEPDQAARLRLVAAIENMLVNALEHGAGRIEISASADQGGTVVVRNPKRTGGADLRDPRRGHGLAVIAGAVEGVGGRFELCDDGAEAVATLELGSRGLDPAPR